MSAAHFQRGLMLFEQARFEQAEEEFRQDLAADPDHAAAHALLGMCLARRQQWKDATREAEQAIHLAPDFPYAHYALASIYHRRNRLPQAVAAIGEAIRLDPENADYHAQKSALHFDGRQWAAALEAADQGLAIDAEHVGCANLRAMSLVKLGRKAEAGATIEATLARNPEEGLTHANQGWTLLEQNQSQKAMEHFREALRLDPENEWARHGIVEALKARYFIYAWVLRYFLWMSKLSTGAQWGVIIGVYFGNQLLASAARSNPDLAPWLLPVRVLLIVALLLTWTADPLFNLLLRLNRFGRLALTGEQKTASNWFGLCLLLALISLGLCLLVGWNTVFLLAAMVFGFLLIPVAGTFKAQKGWPRTVLAVATIALSLLGVGALGLMMMGNAQGGDRGELLWETGEATLTIFLIGVVAFMWGANLVVAQRPRH